MSSQQDNNTFTVPVGTRLSQGIELEMLVAYLDEFEVDPDEANSSKLAPILRLKAPDNANVEEVERDIMEHIRTELRKHGVRVRDPGTGEEGDDQANNFDQWDVGKDLTVTGGMEEVKLAEGKPGNYRWFGLELRSPACWDGPRAHDEFRFVVNLVKSKYRVRVNTSCGFHVHVGNGRRYFDARTLKRVGAFLFAADPMLSRLHAPWRRVGEFSRSIRYDSRLARRHAMTPDDVLEVIRDDASAAGIESAEGVAVNMIPVVPWSDRSTEEADFGGREGWERYAHARVKDGPYITLSKRPPSPCSEGSEDPFATPPSSPEPPNNTDDGNDGGAYRRRFLTLMATPGFRGLCSREFGHSSPQSLSDDEVHRLLILDRCLVTFGHIDVAGLSDSQFYQVVLACGPYVGVTRSAWDWNPELKALAFRDGLVGAELRHPRPLTLNENNAEPNIANLDALAAIGVGGCKESEDDEDFVDNIHQLIQIRHKWVNKLMLQPTFPVHVPEDLESWNEDAVSNTSEADGVVDSLADVSMPVASEFLLRRSVMPIVLEKLRRERANAPPTQTDSSPPTSDSSGIYSPLAHRLLRSDDAGEHTVAADSSSSKFTSTTSTGANAARSEHNNDMGLSKLTYSETLIELAKIPEAESTEAFTDTDDDLNPPASRVLRDEHPVRDGSVSRGPARSRSDSEDGSSERDAQFPTPSSTSRNTPTPTDSGGRPTPPASSDSSGSRTPEDDDDDYDGYDDYDVEYDGDDDSDNDSDGDSDYDGDNDDGDDDNDWDTPGENGSAASSPFLHMTTSNDPDGKRTRDGPKLRPHDLRQLTASYKKRVTRMALSDGRQWRRVPWLPRPAGAAGGRPDPAEPHRQWGPGCSQTAPGPGRCDAHVVTDTRAGVATLLGDGVRSAAAVAALLSSADHGARLNYNLAAYTADVLIDNATTSSTSSNSNSSGGGGGAIGPHTIEFREAGGCLDLDLVAALAGVAVGIVRFCRDADVLVFAGVLERVTREEERRRADDDARARARGYHCRRPPGDDDDDADVYDVCDLLEDICLFSEAAVIRRREARYGPPR